MNSFIRTLFTNFFVWAFQVYNAQWYIHTSTLQSPSISWIPFYRSLYYKTWHKLYLLIFLIQHDIPLYHNHRKCSMCMYAYWIMWLKGFLHHFCTIDGLFVNLECDILLLYRIILHCHIILKKYREKIIFKQI